MLNRATAVGLTLLAVLTGVFAAPAFGAARTVGATKIVPRAGTYTSAVAVDVQPVTFKVPKTGRRITGFIAQVGTKATCKNPITSFSAPVGPMKVNANNHFTARSTNYPIRKGRHITVTVTGTFTSRIAAHGQITVKVTNVKGCNATWPYSVKRVA
jgi:hypothetical protein